MKTRQSKESGISGGTPNPQGNAQFNGQFVQPQQQSVQQWNGDNGGKKKKPILKILLIAIAVFVVGIIAIAFIKAKLNPKQSAIAYETTGRAAHDKLLVAITNYDATAVDSAVGTEDGDSYIAQEWAYVNRVPLREEYIKKITSLVRFEYPNISIGADGVALNSSMDAGESTLVTVPDYDKMLPQIEENKDTILKLYEASGYDPETDYTYEEDMFNLFCQFLLDYATIETKQVEIAFPVGLSATGGKVILDDSELDTYLFATDGFRAMEKAFAMLCMDWTGVEYETYTEKDKVHNDEYDKWYEVFIEYYNADNGKFNPKTSKWEPWYLRNDDNEIQYDENGEKIVNYYSVKDENGKDWIQPDEWILTDVEKQREITIDWVEETGLPYAMLGTYYIQNEYTGKYPTVFRVGNGSVEFPAGIGTTIVTKVLCDDGKYHNVKVALQGYWTDQHAIDYAEGFSSRNKGFTVTSPVRLICMEFTVQNLEKEPITFQSEMCLCDKNYNVSSKTGTLYGFYDFVTLQPKESKLINDWYSSTELAQKYLGWGKSFDREFPIVYFDVLAGTGEIPSYSAYELFTGKKQITESQE